MEDITIYADEKKHILEDALKIITDEWIDNGEYCSQTVVDLKNAIKEGK